MSPQEYDKQMNDILWHIMDTKSLEKEIKELLDKLDKE